ncbi:MAG: PAS domain S-box protein [Candidatus Eremiobacterota bacterium]
MNLPNFEERYRFLAENSTEMVVRLGPRGEIRECSPASTRLLGRRPEELLGLSLLDFVAPDQRVALAQTLSGHTVVGERTALQFGLCREEGTCCWVEAFCHVQRDASGGIAEWVAAVRDITQRKLAHDALERSEQRFRAIFNALPHAVVYTDAELRTVECSPAVRSLFGYEPQELEGRPIWVLFSSSWEGTELLGDRPLDRFEAICLRNTGEPFPAELTRRSVTDGFGHPMGWMWILADLSEKRRTEAELAEAGRRLAESREEERLRLARELHDGVVQELVGIGFRLTELGRALRGSPQDRAVGALRQDVRALVRLVRALISDLRPAGLEEYGLAPALEGLAAKLARDFPSGEVVLDLQEVPELPPSTRVCLFRAAQESLLNALKHSGASRVRLTMRGLGERVHLTVEDDGRGSGQPQGLHPLEPLRSGRVGRAGGAGPRPPDHPFPSRAGYGGERLAARGMGGRRCLNPTES